MCHCEERSDVAISLLEVRTHIEQASVPLGEGRSVSRRGAAEQRVYKINFKSGLRPPPPRVSAILPQGGGDRI